MKNADRWEPSRFELHNGRLRITKNRRQLSTASRLVTTLSMECYNRFIPEHCRGRLLDLGCGKVPFYGYYKQFVDETVCVDWPLSAHGNAHIDHACDLTQPLPFPDASFDTILMSSVLEHIPTPESLWREISRIMRPGGKLLMNVPFLYWLHEAPHDFYRYTEFALRRLAEQSGFEVIELRSLGGAPYVIADIMAKVSAKVPVVGNALASFVQGTCALFVWTPPGRALCGKTRKQFPSGYFMIAQKKQVAPGSAGG